MPVVVHSFPMSPPAQAVQLLVRALGLESAQIRNIDLSKGEHLSPDYLKKFPSHTIPALEDDGFYLTESHAICTYLLNAYAKDDKLYPKDPKKRAVVDKWLHFSNSILYIRLRDVVEPLWTKQSTEIPENKKQRLIAALKELDAALSESKWLCGDQMTVADICSVCEVNGYTALHVDFAEFKAVAAWWQRCKDALPGFQEIVIDANEIYKEAINSMLS